MKLIHLADLHIGKSVNGFSMVEDQVFVLEQILRYVVEHRPQAVVISGDVYDKPTPGADAVRVFDQFLTDLVKENVSIFVVSGNHDSPERLSFASRIMRDHNVHLYGVFDGKMRLVPQKDEYGDVNIYMMPFLKPSTVRRFFDNMEIESYQDAAKAVIDSSVPDGAARNVLVAHQFVISPGAEPERSESEVGPVGGIDSIDTGLFSNFDYVALGHLHGPQGVGRDCVRYAGSPLKYSFSEHCHKKSVSLVELREKGDVLITPLALEPRRDMRRIKGPIAELTSEAVLSQGNPQDYLHVTLTDEEEITDAIGRIRDVYPNVMALEFENSRTRASLDLSEDVPVDQATPFDLFDSFFRAQNGSEMKPEQAEIVKRLMERIDES